jgi:hypothetical protein
MSHQGPSSPTAASATPKNSTFAAGIRGASRRSITTARRATNSSAPSHSSAVITKTATCQTRPTGNASHKYAKYPNSK